MNANRDSGPSPQQKPQQQYQMKRSGPSIIASLMYESHTLRHVGIGMFSTMLFIWILLIRLGIRRREKNDRRQIMTEYEEQRQRSFKDDVQLATDDDVSKMLFIGKEACLVRASCDDLQYHGDHDSRLTRISHSKHNDDQACIT